ncbi:hypothetical protein ACIBHX_49580 [Nonomuraea sp. NPDC050536]|uniref:hypothetical protein n=1 Tax=Nonomuraea sp. NPDC050536 TaxID=3364366 RepID=UPI0037C6AADF
MRSRPGGPESVLFVVIAVLWISNHRVLGMVEVLDRWTLQIDLALLAVIAALPFPTKLLSRYNDSAVAVSIYGGTIAVCGLLFLTLSIHLLRRPELRKPDISRGRIAQSMWQSVAIAAVFATSVPLTLISPSVAEYWWIVSVPLRFLIARHYRD